MEALTMETSGRLLDLFKKPFPEREAETWEALEALIRGLEARALSEEALEARVLSWEALWKVLSWEAREATWEVLGWEILLALSGEGLRAVMAALREALEALSGEALSEALSGEALEALLEALRRARRQALWEAPRQAALEARLKALLESGLQARREAELDAWLRRCYDIFKPCKLEEGAPALTKELIEERIRYLKSVEERRREEALVRRSSFLFSDYRSPDRDISIIPYQYAAQVPDFWSCSLGSERTLGYPRVYGKDLKDYVEQVPDSPSGDSERTLYPYVTGTSVLAVKFRDGILMAADMGGSYGSTLRYKTIERIKPIGKHSLLGASGEISDFQEILCYLDELILYDNMWDDGNSLGPKEVHNYLTRVMYDRRNKFNPLWNSLVLGGVKNGQKYLGMDSMIGVSFEENHVATGFGNHLARPILHDEWNENLSFEDAVKLLEKCMRVLLYRDRSAVNKIQIVKITEEGATNFPPYSLKTFWGFESYKNPTVGEEDMMPLMDSKQVPDTLSCLGAPKQTLYQYGTSTFVVAVKYREGILMAAEMQGFYEMPYAKHCVLGASGEISDFQEIIQDLECRHGMWDDGNSLGPKEMHNYLSRVMYGRRNKFNPLRNSLVLGGVKKGQKLLGMVSMRGVHFEDNHVATGSGNQLAQPILRDEWNENLSFEDGVKLLEKCIRVLLCRDCSAVNNMLQIAKITEEGAIIFPPYSLNLPRL